MSWSARRAGFIWTLEDVTFEVLFAGSSTQSSSIHTGPVSRGPFTLLGNQSLFLEMLPAQLAFFSDRVYDLKFRPA